jgi:hypothetical protein
VFQDGSYQSTKKNEGVLMQYLTTITNPDTVPFTL